jgi:hypothetical protein
MASPETAPVHTPQAAASAPASAISAPLLTVGSSQPRAPAVLASSPVGAASDGIWDRAAGYADGHPQVASAIVSGVGSFFVAALALVGVVASLAHAHYRMKRELQASRDLANEERNYAAEQAVQTRLTELRKNLYLLLIEQYQAAVVILAGLPAVPLAELSTVLANLSGLHASVQKTTLVSEAKTSNAASEAHSRLAELMLQLVALVPPIRSQIDEVEGAEAEMRRLQPIIDQKTEKARDFASRRIMSMDSHSNDQMLHEALESHKAYAERKQAATTRQLALADQYNAVLFAGMKDVAAAATAFLSLARAELGMDHDAAALSLQQEKIFDRVIGALGRMRKAIGIDDGPSGGEGQEITPEESQTATN